MKNSRTKEIKIYGRYACHAFFRIRARDLIRVYISKPLVKEFSACLRWCAENKLAYHIVSIDELSKITESTHHEGICFLVKRKAELKEGDLFSYLDTLPKSESLLILALDGVSNPHNFGSIIRVAAHYGINFILGDDSMPTQSAAAVRVAQGGAEVTSLIRVNSLKSSINKLKNYGFKIFSTDSAKGKNIYTFSYPTRSILLLGGEAQGVSKEVENLSDETIKIQGTGAVESLNVSTATGILLSEWWRQDHKEKR